jgi:hypothetical protein
VLGLGNSHAPLVDAGSPGRDGGSDRFVDEVVAWGDVARIGQRVAEYFATGADHVCLQVIGVPDEQLPMTEWRALATLT